MNDSQFSTFDNRCIELLNASKTRCRGRHSLQNALNHLRRALALRDIDHEMSVFRAVTAEEEAVSGLYYALKHRHYVHANLLDPKSHVHKNAAIPFLQMLAHFFSGFSGTEELAPKLHLKEEDGEVRLRIAISVAISGQTVIAYPVPPLNFGVTSGGKKPDFTTQAKRFLSEQSASNLLDYIRAQANMRNQLLYAGPSGYPVLEEINPSFFKVRQTRVMAMLKTFLLIEPWAERQPFVQQSLDAFLVMLGKIEHEVLDPET
jgi:hypothetical protein